MVESKTVQPSVSDAAVASARPATDAATSVAPSAAPSRPRPKRPLSGYNLFYRFKRSEVLEATARLKRGGGPVSPAEERRVVDSVLRAPPGLEGVPPGHAVWSFPVEAVNELRASNIRHAMEGKLLPNENARNRLHRKAEGMGGMGFVEMGRVMREEWARADRFTKNVFCELAEVGRARYRMKNGSPPKDDKDRARLTKARQASMSVDGIVATPAKNKTTPFTSLKHGLVSPSSAVNGQEAAIHDGIAPLCPLPGSRRISNAFQDPVYCQEIKNDSPRGSLDLPNQSCRRVTVESADFPTSFANLLASSSANESAHRDISNAFAQYLRNAGIPPPPLVTRESSPAVGLGEGAAPSPSASLDANPAVPCLNPAMSRGESAYLDVSAGPAPTSPAGVPRLTDLERAILREGTVTIEPEPIVPRRDVSAGDFLELIGTLCG